MEIPRIEIPQIKIKEIYIPRTRTWEQYPTTLDIIDKPPEYKPKVKKDKEFFIKCPSEDNIPVGSYPNDLKLQVVIGHSVKNGRCYEIFRDSTFIEKWIPSTPVLVNTSIIAVTAAGSPIIANLLKNLIKTAIKKLSKKKDKSKVQT